MALPGQHVPRRPDPHPAGVGADVRRPDQDFLPAGAAGAQGVFLLQPGGRQPAQDQVKQGHSGDGVTDLCRVLVKIDEVTDAF